jgi:hypothetical protein
MQLFNILLITFKVDCGTFTHIFWHVLSYKLTSAHILCRCEVLALLRHAHLGSLEPEDMKSQTEEAGLL